MYPGLSKNTVCNWAIYGWPVQNELTVENHMVRVARYIEELRLQNEFLRNIIKVRQDVIDEQREKLESTIE